MSLGSRITNFFTTSERDHSQQDETSVSTSIGHAGQAGDLVPNTNHMGKIRQETAVTGEMDDSERIRAPYLHCMLAGGVGGTTGDLLMHSIDTVKTRQQGDPHMPPKYTSLSSSYYRIFKQEGLRRGLYGGVFPAFIGSFPGTIIFFGVYEYSKRHLIDAGVNPGLAYLTGGFVADLAASVVYVPSEVLKTRLQLQGRHNNPFFSSGYNYRSTFDATRTIIRQEGFSALFYGYKATLVRDLPFSALQFAFYEQSQKWAKEWVGPERRNNIGLGLEILTGAAAGGLAGVITCPLDVVKTRIQTQVNKPPVAAVMSALKTPGSAATVMASPNLHAQTRSAARSSAQRMASNQVARHRSIATSSPSTSKPRPGAPTLDTSSVMTGLKMIYRSEGVAGWFRGVGPRLVWTSVQSGTMLVLYQALLRQLDNYPLVSREIVEGDPIV